MIPAPLIASIRQRLLNLSRVNGEAFDLTLSRFGVERFLYRLGISEMAERFVLKGASLFHVWGGRAHRPTRDLDLLASGPADPDWVKRTVLAIMETNAPEDALWFDGGSLVVEPIREDMIYGGMRAKFRAMLGNVRIPVQVDMGFGDAVVPGPESREYPPLLDDLPTATLRVYPVATVVAEKFEALVRLDAGNSRMKDFFDLDFLLARDAPDRETLSRAIHATFERRAGVLPDAVPTGLTDRFAADRQVMWAAFLRKNGLGPGADDFQSVIGRIRKKLRWVWEDGHIADSPEDVRIYM